MWVLSYFKNIGCLNNQFILKAVLIDFSHCTIQIKKSINNKKRKAPALTSFP